MEFFLLFYNFSFSLREATQELVDLLVEAFPSLNINCSVQVFKLILGEVSNIFFLRNLLGRKGREPRHELYYFFISLWLIAQLLEHCF